MWSLNLQIHLQYASLKWNCFTHQKHIHQVSTFNHVIVHCIYFATLFVVCRVDVQPESEATPFVEDTVIETSSARQAAPPLIISIKTHFPLYLLCMNRMITLCRFLPHS